MVFKRWIRQAVPTLSLDTISTTASGDSSAQPRSPFYELSELSVEGDFILDIDPLLAMLEMCSELVASRLAQVWTPVDVDQAARFIVKCWPEALESEKVGARLGRRASCHLFTRSRYAGANFGRFRFVTSHYPDMSLGSTLGRHFGSLYRIMINSVEAVISGTIQKTLCNCSLLEVLAIEGPNDQGSIRLEDAVAYPWASTKFDALKHIIDIGDADIPTLDFTDLSLDQRAKLEQLDTLYRQLGLLRNLTHLDLKIWAKQDGVEDEDGDEDGDDDEDDLRQHLAPFIDLQFPGQLKLGEDKMNERRGWLNCLAALTKLKVLVGSFDVSVGADDCVIGEAEAAWVVNHWPNPSAASIYYARPNEHGESNYSIDFPPWLKQKRPHLSIVVTVH